MLDLRNISVFSLAESDAALKAAKTTSPLVQQCQKALNDISNLHSVGLFGFLDTLRVRGNEIADELAREGTVRQFVGPEPAWGSVRQNLSKNKTLDGQPAYGKVAGSYYTETGSKTDFGP
jgi:hypothetical protein